jgi:hypothetical protein
MEEVDVVQRPPYWMPPFNTTPLKQDNTVKDDNALSGELTGRVGYEPKSRT